MVSRPRSQFYFGGVLLHAVDGIEGPAIAGYSSQLDHSYRVELLPGPHELELSFAGVAPEGGRVASEHLSFTFDFEAGKSYRISGLVSVHDGMRQWKPEIFEVEDE